MSGRRGAQPHGVLVVDKPAGMTSHDVVSHVRRVYGTRRVGHAGTLDPMATGVLVLLLGEATKLSEVLTTQKKAYVTTVRFGIGTDSLDADGKITTQKELPEGGIERSALDAALADERARTLQVPPAVSAISVGGQRAYALARRGRAPDLPPRNVQVERLVLGGFDGGSATLELAVSKGYYVRALARDLGNALGFPAHLTSLRRTESGAFSLSGAAPLPLERPFPLRDLVSAVRLALPTAVLTAEGALRAMQGKRLSVEHFEAEQEPFAARSILNHDDPFAGSAEAEDTPPADRTVPARGPVWPPVLAALADGALVALLEPSREPELLQVRRGFASTTDFPHLHPDGADA